MTLIALAGCGRAARPCTAGVACAPDATCTAGTCTTAAALPPRAAVRVVAKPVAIAWVRRGADAPESIATLGEGARSGKVLLRFATPIESADRLVAAYVIVTRVPAESPLGRGDGAGAILHAERIVDVWDERSVGYANQPRTFDVGLPRVRAFASGLERLRIDVREIVVRWPRHDAADQGIALVGEGAPAVDIALATLPPDVGGGGRPLFGPELELYFSPR